MTEPFFMTNAFDDVEINDGHMYFVVIGNDGDYYNIGFNLIHIEKTKTWKNLLEGSVLRPDDVMKQLGTTQFGATIEEFASFLSYRPVENLLREVKDSPIYPLGIRGEGLMQ